MLRPLVRACLLPALVLCAGCDRAELDVPYEIVRSFPHDPEAFTQGLLFHDGSLYESTGQYGASSLRRVDPRTGRVLERVALDSAHFGEGLARVDAELIQLTWKESVALVYDLETLEPTDTLSYEGQGWGLCFDGASLYMSDGSDTLQRRDPETFELVERIPVTRDGYPQQQLNELECVGEHVWANVYQTNRIVRIEKATGRITGILDGASLRIAAGPPREGDAVLNGIAYVPETDVFLLTGKLWPEVLAVRLMDGGGG